jgi:hypothetical protein
MRDQKTKKQTKFPKATLWVAAVIFTAACVLTTIEVSTDGVEINKLTAQEQGLTDSQVSLNRELVEESSLGGIGEKATAMGFDKPAKTIYIGKATEFSASLQ